MNLRCRSVAAITGSFIRLEMKLAWWEARNINALEIARELWEQTHPHIAPGQN